MNKKVKILFLEDNETDAELNLLVLVKSHFTFTSQRVETRDQFIQALGEFKPDIILADYSLPSFDGMEALSIVLKKEIKIPFIFVTGSLGEELAVETIKRGATDYVLKQNLSRLVHSVRRALQEIEERKKLEEAEKALRESERMLNEAEKVACIGSWTFDLNTEKLNCSEEMYRIFGIDPDEFNGSMEMAVRNIHPEDLPRIKEAIRSILINKVPQPMEYRILIPGGEERIVWAEGRLERDEKGEPVRLVGYTQDITERSLIEDELQNYRQHLEELVRERTIELEKTNAKLEAEIADRTRIEEELARGRNMLRTLIDSLPDEIYAKDNESRFTMANSHVIRSFGRTSFEEIIGKTDFDLLPKEEAMKAYMKEHSVLQGNGHIINYEEHSTDNSSRFHWYSITKVPMYDKEGRIIGLVGINRDITDFKKAEESLNAAKEAAESANRAKSTFLSSMSHEIRTPLNAVLGFSELMMHDDNLTPRQIEYLATINRSGEHLLSLINDILEISKIEAGHISFNLSSFDLHVLLQEIEAMFKVKAEAKNLNLLVEYSDNLPKFIATDEIKLRQILINIIGNAVKFTHEGGIAVRARTNTDTNGRIKLEVEVEDTGPGIAQKDIVNLFQMFGQTEIGIKEEGTGMGLAISQQYAKIMGGNISVKSEIGKGTCFFIIVNIEKGEEPLIKEDYSKGNVKKLKHRKEPYRVLIADDRIDNRKLLRGLLISFGFEVDEAQDGMEAIKKFKVSLPDLILMDIRMPVMNGYEAIKSIKAMCGKKIPIIAVTASAFYEDKQKALEAGADAYIRKPFKKHELLECIESCIGFEYTCEGNTNPGENPAGL